jgi:hypothetical protein
MRDAILFCLRREHVRWTLRVALVMGVVYTAVNQADVIVRGDGDVLLLVVKVPLNFLAPFVVANIGLLGSRRRATDAPPYERAGRPS